MDFLAKEWSEFVYNGVKQIRLEIFHIEIIVAFPLTIVGLVVILTDCGLTVIVWKAKSFAIDFSSQEEESSSVVHESIHKTKDNGCEEQVALVSMIVPDDFDEVHVVSGELWLLGVVGGRDINRVFLIL